MSLFEGTIIKPSVCLNTWHSISSDGVRDGLSLLCVSGCLARTTNHARFKRSTSGSQCSSLKYYLKTEAAGSTDLQCSSTTSRLCHLFLFKPCLRLASERDFSPNTEKSNSRKNLTTILSAWHTESTSTLLTRDTSRNTSQNTLHWHAVWSRYLPLTMPSINRASTPRRRWSTSIEALGILTKMSILLPGCSIRTICHY